MVGMTAELEVLENSARRLQTVGVTRPVIVLGQARQNNKKKENQKHGVKKHHISDRFASGVPVVYII